MASHTAVKKALMELGESTERYKAKSGDSEPLDVRLGKRHITYRQDVYWLTPQGRIMVFEIPLTEDERAIVGELCLASLVPNAVRFFAIFNDKQKANRMRPFITIADDQIRDEYGKCRLKKKARIIFIPENIGRGRRQLRKFLSTKLRRWLE